jgi:hypothetical protein
VLTVLARTVLAVGLGGALAAFQMLPVLDVLAISNRSARMEWDFRTAASLPPWHLFTLLGPDVFGEPDRFERPAYAFGPPYEWHERLIYVGTVPLVAAGLAAGRWRWLCPGAAGIAVAFAFGGYAPWYPLVEWLPGYANLRIPSKHLALASLGLALAAGVGFDRLRGRRAAVACLGLAVLVAVLGLTATWWVPAASWLGGTELITSMARQQLVTVPMRALRLSLLVLALAALTMWVPEVRARRLILVALTALDLVLALGPYRLQLTDVPTSSADQAALQGYRRAAFIGDGAPSLANYGPVMHVTQPGGYVSLFSGEYMTLLTGRSNAKVEIEVQRDAAPYLSLLDYEAIVERRGAGGRTTTPTITPLTPLGAWVARCSWPGGALDVRARDFPRQSCVTRRAATTRERPTDPGPARIVGERPNGLTLEAEGPGWLVVPRPWYPGWAAASDGAALAVEPVDGALIGVLLPAGRHMVTLGYWPAGLTRGLIVSALAGLAVLALWLLGRSAPIPDRPAGSLRGVRRWLNWASS